MKAPSKIELSGHQAIATVTACKYEFGAGQALAFGIPLRKHFLISFNYSVNGELHTGEFASRSALPQGHLFPVTYDPADPQNNSHSGSSAGSNGRWVMLVVFGTLIFLLVWLALGNGRPGL